MSDERVEEALRVARMAFNAALSSDPRLLEVAGAASLATWTDKQDGSAVALADLLLGFLPADRKRIELAVVGGEAEELWLIRYDSGPPHRRSITIADLADLRGRAGLELFAERLWQALSRL